MNFEIFQILRQFHNSAKKMQLDRRGVICNYLLCFMSTYCGPKHSGYFDINYSTIAHLELIVRSKTV